VRDLVGHAGVVGLRGLGEAGHQAAGLGIDQVALEPAPRLRRQARVSISASPLRTDSGSLLFEVRVRPR